MIALQDWQATKEKIISLSGWSATVSTAFKNALDSSKRKGRCNGSCWKELYLIAYSRGDNGDLGLSSLFTNW